MITDEIFNQLKATAANYQDPVPNWKLTFEYFIHVIAPYDHILVFFLPFLFMKLSKWPFTIRNMAVAILIGAALSFLVWKLPSILPQTYS